MASNPKDKKGREKTMRWVTVKSQHPCTVCKKTIYPGAVAIQSQSQYELFYHEDCHWERFRGSRWHEPKNDKPGGGEK
jgi:hypothetical protein